MTTAAPLGPGTTSYPMVEHLQREGYHVCVYNRSSVRTLHWIEEYVGRYVGTPCEVCAGTELVFCCVSNDDNLCVVALGEQGVFAGVVPGSLSVDHITTSAEVARELSLLATEHELGFLDAPVSGGQVSAADSALTVMAGGEEAFYRRVELPPRSYMRMVRRIGDVGGGQLIKTVNQICVTELLQGLAKTLYFTQCAGLDGEAVIRVIGKDAVQSWQLESRHQSMPTGEPGFDFAVDWTRGDLSILFVEARRSGVQLPVTALVDRFYTEVQVMGGGHWDTSSLVARLRP